MTQYNMTAEYLSFIIISIIIISFLWDKEEHTLKNKFFINIFTSIAALNIFTIFSFTADMNHEVTPIWLNYSLNTIYFCLLPVTIFSAFIYLLAIDSNDSLRLKNIDKRYFLVLIPYIAYILFIISNLATGVVFYVNDASEYIRGPLYQIPYLVIGIYGVFIVTAAFLKRKSIHSSLMAVILATYLLSSMIVTIQFFVPTIVVASFGSTIGALIIYIYVFNSKKVTDKLTGMGNRSSFTHTINKLTRKEKPFTIVVFSIRDFKSINERQSLEFGNDVLKKVSLYLTKLFPVNSVYRYNGDEFAVILELDKHLDKIQTIKTAARRFNSPFDITSRDSINLNIVYTRVDFPEFGLNSKDLISALDYSISRLKKDYTDDNYSYNVSVCDEIRRKNDIVTILKNAIENNGFEIHHQPIFDASTDSFTQTEALLRMKPINGKQIYPSEFIPIAEEIGVISEMTYIVLEKVCQDLNVLSVKSQRSEKSSYYLESVSINFPYVQFLQPDMMGKVMSILDKYNISPDQIKIEITERTLVSDVSFVKEVVSQMQKKGFIFELDDFGVEYSNLSILLDLPLEIIKIDRSLITAVLEKGENKVFFNFLIKGLKGLNRKIVIEGVETKTQLDYLLSLGCDFIQGYFFSKPLPLNELRDFLEAHNNLDK